MSKLFGTFCIISTFNYEFNRILALKVILNAGLWVFSVFNVYCYLSKCSEYFFHNSCYPTITFKFHSFQFIHKNDQNISIRYLRKIFNTSDVAKCLKNRSVLGKRSSFSHDALVVPFYLAPLHWCSPSYLSYRCCHPFASAPSVLLW